MKSNPLAARTTALACYAVALAGGGALAGRVLLLGAGYAPPTLSFAAPWSWVIDLAWLLAFGLQHSIMARDGFKRRWTRIIPASLERSVYAALSGLLLLGLSLTWQAIPGPDWWRGPLLLMALPLLAGAGAVLVNLRFDHAGLFGVRQAWTTEAPAPERLQIVGPYRYIRHPLMACLLGFLWLQPVMPPTLALLSGGLTLYVAVGVFLEERDLLRRFHPLYAAYRRRVPALIPWRRPAAQADFAEGQAEERS